jgi:hypothetical protein
MERYPKANYVSPHEWHIYYVYNDPEFLSEYVGLVPYIDSKYGGKPTIKVKTKPKVFDETIFENKLDQLAEAFGISTDDIKFYRLRYQRGGKLNRDSNPRVSYNREERVVEVTVKPDIPQKDFEVLWYTIQDLKADLLNIAPTKRKTPEDPKLLYAIFKARHRQPKTKFKDIYALYSTGELAYYQGETDTKNWLSDEFSLKSYYYRYYPKDKK